MTTINLPNDDWDSEKNQRFRCDDCGYEKIEKHGEWATERPRDGKVYIDSHVDACPNCDPGQMFGFAGFV